MRIANILRQLLLVAIAASPTARIQAQSPSTWNFEFEFDSVFEPQADQFLVQQTNAQKINEGGGITFWTPVFTGIPATLRYHFPFGGDTTQIHVRAQMSVWNYSLGVGEGSYWASTDGTNWIQLFALQVPAPGLPMGGGTSIHLDVDLPSSHIGTNELWLEARMLRHSGSYPYGAVQFCRFGPGYPTPGFSVQARFGPTASYAPFGGGCPGAGGVTPTLVAPAGQAPIIGAASTIRVESLPLAVTIPVFIFGFSTAYATGPSGNYPLPADLGGLGWTGCQQLVSLNDTVYTITTSGFADHQVILPQLAFLAGLQFHVQGLVLYSSGEVATTNGLTATAGW
ncbi:MAG: hypothetical protein R3F29_04580 [Planctomycetota bacterium]